MTRPLLPLEKVGLWDTAFEAIRQTITPPIMRKILDEMNEVEGIAQLQSYMSLARNVMANDRTAAIVAAMLVGSGVRPIVTEEETA